MLKNGSNDKLFRATSVILAMFIFICIFSLSASADTAPSAVWSKTYSDSPRFQYIDSVAQAADGSYYMAGYKVDGSITYGVLIKTDANGVQQWSNTYRYPINTYSYNRYNQFMSITSTSDGNFLLGGTTSSSGTNNYGWLVKVSPAGTQLWNKYYGVAGSDSTTAFNSVIESGDGSYLAAGCNNYKGWLLDVNKANGNQIWSNTSYSSSGSFSSVIQSGNNYLVSGNSIGQGWIMKAALNGTLQSSATYGSNYDNFMSVAPADDGGYLLAGTTYSFGGQNCWLTKFSPAGVQQWNETVANGPGRNYATSVIETSDGCYLVGGAMSTGSQYPLMAKVRADGTELWNATYGPNSSITMSQVIQANDGSYILAGASYNAPYPIGLLVKVTGTNQQFQFHAPKYSAAENAGNVTITVDRINGNPGIATVQYATSDGTAIAGNDYTATSGYPDFPQRRQHPDVQRLGQRRWHIRVDQVIQRSAEQSLTEPRVSAR